MSSSSRQGSRRLFRNRLEGKGICEATKDEVFAVMQDVYANLSIRQSDPDKAAEMVRSAYNEP